MRVFHLIVVDLTVGGLMGYLKSGSQKSLLAGGLSASVLYYVHTQLPTNPVYASSIGLGKKLRFMEFLLSFGFRYVCCHEHRHSFSYNVMSVTHLCIKVVIVPC